jgi:hypothetical protein
MRSENQFLGFRFLSEFPVLKYSHSEYYFPPKDVMLLGVFEGFEDGLTVWGHEKNLVNLYLDLHFLGLAPEE